MIAFGAEQLILVTGASSGIGRATARLLNQLGATVVINGRDGARLEETRANAPFPEKMILAPRDLLADMESLPDWVRSISAAHGKLAGLAFCAGQTWNIPMQAWDMETARMAFDLCCNAPLLVARGFCDRRASIDNGASLVFLAAMAGSDPNPGQGIYGAAKAALVTAVRCLAREIAPRKLRANCISPGLVETPMMEETVTQLGVAFLEREAPFYPLGFGSPNDVAHMAAFLLSPQSAWMTGQNILLTGGR